MGILSVGVCRNEDGGGVGPTTTNCIWKNHADHKCNTKIMKILKLKVTKISFNYVTNGML